MNVWHPIKTKYELGGEGGVVWIGKMGTEERNGATANCLFLNFWSEALFVFCYLYIIHHVFNVEITKFLEMSFLRCIVPMMFTFIQCIFAVERCRWTCTHYYLLSAITERVNNTWQINECIDILTQRHTSRMQQNEGKVWRKQWHHFLTILPLLMSFLLTALAVVSSRSLCHNPDKTEFIWLGSPRKLDMITITSFNLLRNIIHASDTVRDLGVILDPSLNCGKHISKLTQTCSYQQHQLQCICRCLSPQVAEQFVHGFVNSRLDYCNSILCSLPASHTRRLQKTVLNSASRLVAGSRRFDHITPVLKSLHWLSYPINLLCRNFLSVQ